MAQLEMEEQGPAEADAIKHLGEDIHAATLIRWTVGHNTRTIAPYRLSRLPLRCRRGRPGVMRATPNDRNAILPKRPPTLGRASSDTLIG